MVEYLIDFDGVILDSQDRFLEVMKDGVDLGEWIDYLTSIDWYNFLRECEEINNSISILLELQKQNKIKCIITAIHSFNEGKEKLIYLREKGITVPIIYSLPEQKKSEVVIPQKNLILVDDKLKNCEDWEQSGGKSILFDPYNKMKFHEKIKSLQKLL